MESDIKSPGPGWRYLHFSDGKGAWMNPALTDQQWAQIKAQGEAERDARYMAQAKAENRPITTQDKVYSSTVVRPNGPYGQLMAWLDHNAGGNALNANSTAKAISDATHEGVASGARIATGAIEAEPHVRAVDLPITGLNVAKHLAARVVPGLNNVPDFQTILGLTRHLTGTPELDPNASASQRVLENAASLTAGGVGTSAPALSNFFGRLSPPGVTGLPADMLENVARAGMSHIGGLAGEEIAGEPGQFVGSFIGGSPESARAIAQRTLAPFFRGRNTADVSGAADRQGIQPSLGSVSNAMGRLFEKGLAATPFVGARVRSAQERFNDAIRQRQQELGEDVFGGPLPGNISDESIGQSLIDAARQGSANITQRASNEQQDLISGPGGIGSKTPVDARGVYRGPAGYASARLRMGANQYPAYAARLDEIRQAAIEAQHPFFQQFWGQLAAGEVPYERFQRLRSGIGQDIEGFAGMAKGDQDQLYEAMTDAMRDAAFQRGGQALVDRFDAANDNYERLIGKGGQRDKLAEIGGKPQSGGWEQFFGPQGQTQTTAGTEFTGGKGQGQAAQWFKGNLQSPDKLAPFADPTIVPNQFWRQVVGQWLASRGQTLEGTFRPDQMATELGGEGVKTTKGTGNQVQSQLFMGPNNAPTTNVQDVNDIATLGRNAVVAQNRSGLTDTAGVMYALKKLSDWATQGLGTVGGLATMGIAGRGLSDPEFVNAVRGQGTPLVNSLYAGIPAATQNILQYQNNPPPRYDPLGWSVTSGQASSQ